MDDYMDNFIRKLDAVFIEGIMHPLIMREYSEDIIDVLDENNLMEDFDEEKDFVEDFDENNDSHENDLQVLLEYEYLNGTKVFIKFYEEYFSSLYMDFLDGFIVKWGIKGIIFGLGLLKLLNEALKHLNEEEYNILNDGVEINYLYDFFGSDFFGIIDAFSKYSEIADEKNVEFDSEKAFKLENLTGFFPIYDYNKKWFSENSELFNAYLEPEKDMDKVLFFFIFSFRINIIEIFKKIEFLDFISVLKNKSLLTNVINGLNWIELPPKYFTSLDTFVNTVENFIDTLCDYDLGNEEILYKNYSDGREQLYRENDALRDETLVELLFNNMDLEKYDKINIYDPCCDNVNLIRKTLGFIRLKNYNCEVNFYGKLNFNNSYFDTTKVMFYSLLNENVFLSDEKIKFPFGEISFDEINFIISDFRGIRNDSDYFFLYHLDDKLPNSPKVVMTFNKEYFENNLMTSTISTDYLESIITFHNYYILILNSNKEKNRKNKFLLVDYTLLDTEYVNKLKDPDEEFMRELGLIDPYIKKAVIDSKHMKTILEAYADFRNTDFSKVVNNDEVISFEYGFIYNHLFYDLKRKPSSIMEKLNIKREINEDEIEFVPLYSLITFDEDKIGENGDAYKIRKFDYTFYVTSENILRNFLLYYLNSDIIKDEYDYFKNSFGFAEVSGDVTYMTEHLSNKEFVCMRIPLLDIEIQKKIIQPHDSTSEILEAIKDLKRDAHEISEKIDTGVDKVIKNDDTNTEKVIQNNDSNAEKIIDEINKLGEQLEQLNEDIADYKHDVSELLNNNDSNYEEEKILSDFTNNCVKKIRSSLEDKIVGTHHYATEERILIDTFDKPAWEKLSRQSKTFLTTAKVTFNSLEPLGDNVDYSGVCLLVTKALEVELTKRFFKGFYAYLEKNEMPFEEYHTSLLEYKNGELLKKPKDHQSLGNIPYLLCYSKHKIPEIHEKNVSILIEYAKENLFEDLSDEEIRETLRKYGKDIKNITFKYRNRAAHVDEIDRTKAKECFDFIIDVQQFLKTMLDSFDKENPINSN